MARRPLLISMFLRGGADGLSLAQPLGSGLLKEARPTLATPDADLVDVGGGVGLHPELHDLAELMSRGEASVCLGVGSGDSTRSHFEAQDRLERASEEEVLSSGWIARHLMTRAGPRPGPLSAIAFGAGPPEALRGASATSVHDTRELVPERPTEVGSTRSTRCTARAKAPRSPSRGSSARPVARPSRSRARCAPWAQRSRPPSRATRRERSASTSLRRRGSRGTAKRSGSR